jgi:two-component system cell cycle response regulator DivK
MPKILLIEDNVTIRDMLSRRLQKRGYDVAVAADGASAVQAAHADRPDLILMDMHLPVVDGWEATRQLKSDEATRDVPIIALTADAMAGDREKALQAGCNDYETKPIDLPRLLAKVQRLLQTRTEA